MYSSCSRLLCVDLSCYEPSPLILKVAKHINKQRHKQDFPPVDEVNKLELAVGVCPPLPMQSMLYNIEN